MMYQDNSNSKDHPNSNNNSHQVLSQRPPPLKPNVVKKADLTPYMAAVDPHYMENQMRMNTQGFFTAANSKQLFS